MGFHARNCVLSPRSPYDTAGMSLRFPPEKKMEFDDRLIKSVKTRPILYDNKRKEYKDLTAKNAAWREVAQETGQPAQECMIRWRALRDRFVRARKSQYTLPMSGDDAPSQSREPWPLLDKMEFLASFISHRSKGSNSGRNNNSNHHSATATAINNNGHHNNQRSSSSRRANLQADDGPVSPSSLLQTMLQYEEEPIFPAAPLSDTEEEEEEELSSGGNSAHLPMTDQPHSPLNGQVGYKPFEVLPPRYDLLRDEDELYCLSLVGPIRRLPYYKRTQAKIRIMQVLYEMEDSQS